MERRGEAEKHLNSSFGSLPPFKQMDLDSQHPKSRDMDKIAGLKEVLEGDPKNSFARYGLAMELASQGETAAALSEFDTLLANDPSYTAGYFMSAQTLATACRTAEAIARLKLGVESAKNAGNHHAVSEMQAMLDELDR
jgi:predicted Zn-dependent protease